MKLQAYLSKNKLSQHKFGKMCGISQSAVCFYISGVNVPNKKNMKKIIDATNGEVRANDFFDEGAESVD